MQSAVGEQLSVGVEGSPNAGSPDSDPAARRRLKTNGGGNANDDIRRSVVNHNGTTSMARKTSTSQCRVVEVQNPEWIIAYLEYVRDDLRMLSPMGAHLLDMAIKQVIEDTNSSESLEDQDAV